MTQGGGAMADDFVGMGLIAGSDAFEPVPVVVFAAKRNVMFPGIVFRLKFFRTDLNAGTGGHGGNPAAFAHDYAAEVSVQYGIIGNGAVEAFYFVPTSDQVQQLAIGIFVSEGRKFVAVGVDKFNGTTFFIAHCILQYIGRVGVVPRGGSCAEVFAK